MDIQFTTRVFKEGRTFVAHALELDVSSCGGSAEKAVKNLKEAVRLFLEECEKMGTLERVLQEAGYAKSGQKLRSPKLVSMQQISLPLPLTHGQSLALFHGSFSPRSSKQPGGAARESRAITWSSRRLVRSDR